MPENTEILIVDDNEPLAESLLDIMEFYGYGARIALTGEQALGLCCENRFRLALVDIKLPDIPGNKLIRLMRERIHDLQCVIITGQTAVEDKEAAVGRNGVVAHLTKPFAAERLVELVRNMPEQRLKTVQSTRFKLKINEVLNHQEKRKPRKAQSEILFSFSIYFDCRRPVFCFFFVP